MDLSRALLRITADEPGQILALESEGPTLPGPMDGQLGAAALLGVVRGVLKAAGATEAETLWRPHRVRCDRAAGVLSIEDVQVVGEEDRRESIVLSDVAGLAVRTRGPRVMVGGRPAPGPPRGVEAVVHLHGGASPARARTIVLDVADLDTCAKAADLAYRLAAAMGFHHQRVVRSDPRRIEIEFSHEATTGQERVPPVEGHADYARDVVAPAAARTAAEHRMPPLAPATFPGAMRITRWAPGDEVRIDKPLGGSAFGCLLVALACLLMGPALWLGYHDRTATAIAGTLGLLFGGLALVGVAVALPRHVLISWPAQELTVSGMGRRRTIPFHHLAGLELECIRSETAGGRAHHHVYYRCALRAQARGDGAPATPMELMETRDFEWDPETPYDATLPLASSLAEALGVGWRVSDYN